MIITLTIVANSEFPKGFRTVVKNIIWCIIMSNVYKCTRCGTTFSTQKYWNPNCECIYCRSKELSKRSRIRQKERPNQIRRAFGRELKENDEDED